MGRTPERFPGARHEEGLILDQETDEGLPVTDPEEMGGTTYHNGSFAMRDAIGVFNPRDGGGFSTDNVKRLLINSRGHVLHDVTGELVLKVGP